MADALLDATGLKCPIPVLKARKLIRSMSGGETFEVLATDPGAVEDFEAFCATGGHELLEQTRDGEVFRFLIKVAERAS
jgi:tRNA 2-thiouridine synthesizing protein A